MPVLAQEDERRAISRDLHDDIGQAITAIKLSAYAAQDEDDPQRRGEDLAQIVSLADTTVAKLRDISTLLRYAAGRTGPGSGAELAGTGTVPFLAGGAAGRDQPLPHRPDNSIEQACFRIAQESLTNVLRHARASQVAAAARASAARPAPADPRRRRGFPTPTARADWA